MLQLFLGAHCRLGSGVQQGDPALPRALVRCVLLGPAPRAGSARHRGQRLRSKGKWQRYCELPYTLVYWLSICVLSLLSPAIICVSHNAVLYCVVL